MSPHSTDRQAGRGFIGFIIALVVVGLVGYSLKQYYAIKVRADDMDDFTYELIQQADRNGKKVDDVRFEILKRAKEQNVPLTSPEAVEVLNDTNGWHVRFSWDDELVLPGYRHQLHHSVSRDWKRF